MNLHRLATAAALAIAVLGPGSERSARAAAVWACDASDIIATEGAANCPDSASDPCFIRSAYKLRFECDGGPQSGTACTKHEDCSPYVCSDAGQCVGGPNAGKPCTRDLVCQPYLCTQPAGCGVFDFGNRDVTITKTGSLNIESGVVTIKAANFTIAPGGFILGKGNNNKPPHDSGGTIIIEANGAVAVSKEGTKVGRINVSGNDQGGTIVIKAAGSFNLSGRLRSDGLLGGASGGLIDIRCGGDVVTSKGSLIKAVGGIAADGGEVDITAAGLISLEDEIKADGGEGGVVDISGGQEVTVDAVSAIGAGDGGSGDMCAVAAGRTMHLTGPINVKGTGSTSGFWGGDGGFFTADALFGDIIVEDTIVTEGGSPDGWGGDLELTAKGSISIAPLARVSAKGNGAQSCAGDVTLDAALDILSLGKIDASGGDCGSAIDVSAGRNVTLGKVDASAGSANSMGGELFAEASAGALTLTNTVNVGAGGCNSFGCGNSGDVDLSACDVNIQSTAQVLARAPQGGLVFLTSRNQITINGPVDATSTGGSGKDGINDFLYPTERPPQINAPVTPPQGAQDLPWCTGPGQTLCLLPCPNCGDGTVDFPESCDDGNLLNCDGCSAFCEVESLPCDDGNPCREDLCDPTLGCGSVAIADETPCDDGVFCNGTDTCRLGLCLHSGNPCTGGPECANQCSEAAQTCLSPVDTPCTDDGDPCTSDVCDGAGTCTHDPGPPLCGDGIVCGSETCDGPPESCPSGELCIECACTPGELGDCMADGNGVDIFDVLASVDIVLGRTSPTPEQEVMCDNNCDSFIDLFDVLRDVDAALGRLPQPLTCP